MIWFYIIMVIVIGSGRNDAFVTDLFVVCRFSLTFAQVFLEIFINI